MIAIFPMTSHSLSPWQCIRPSMCKQTKSPMLSNIIENITFCQHVETCGSWWWSIALAIALLDVVRPQVFLASPQLSSIVVLVIIHRLLSMSFSNAQLVVLLFSDQVNHIAHTVNYVNTYYMYHMPSDHAHCHGTLPHIEQGRLYPDIFPFNYIIITVPLRLSGPIKTLDPYPDDRGSG